MPWQLGELRVSLRWCDAWAAASSGSVGCRIQASPGLPGERRPRQPRRHRLPLQHRAEVPRELSLTAPPAGFPACHVPFLVTLLGVGFPIDHSYLHICFGDLTRQGPRAQGHALGTLTLSRNHSTHDAPTAGNGWEREAEVWVSAREAPFDPWH